MMLKKYSTLNVLDIYLSVVKNIIFYYIFDFLNFNFHFTRMVHELYGMLTYIFSSRALTFSASFKLSYTYLDLFSVPSRVAGFKVSSITNQSFVCSWKPVDNSRGYRITVNDENVRKKRQAENQNLTAFQVTKFRLK